MENKPNKPKDNEYFLDLLKKEIIAVTNNGEVEDAVFEYNGYEIINGQLNLGAKYYNPRYKEETGFYEIHRLLPSPKSGMFNNSLIYAFHENSSTILSRSVRWDGNLDGCNPNPDREYNTPEQIEACSRLICDGLSPPDDQAAKILRRHYKYLKKHFKQEVEVPPSAIGRKIKNILDKILHDIE